MANCAICSTELKFMNTPVLGAGKLSNGEMMCSKCFLKLNNVNPRFATGSKNYTPEQIKEMLQPAGGSASPDRIQEQLMKIGISKSSSPAIWGRREIAELPAIIQEDEEMFGLVQGVYNGGQGILVATNKRLLFIDKGLIYGLKVEDFGLDKITSVQYESGLLFADIKIMASGNIAKIQNVEKNSGRIFSEKVRAKLSEPKASAAPVTVVQQQVDVADQLGKLAALKDQGILTQEEFDAQKKKLLGL